MTDGALKNTKILYGLSFKSLILLKIVEKRGKELSKRMKSCSYS